MVLPELHPLPAADSGRKLWPKKRFPLVNPPAKPSAAPVRTMRPFEQPGRGASPRRAPGLAPMREEQHSPSNGGASFSERGSHRPARAQSPGSARPRSSAQPPPPQQPLIPPTMPRSDDDFDHRARAGELPSRREVADQLQAARGPNEYRNEYNATTSPPPQYYVPEPNAQPAQYASSPPQPVHQAPQTLLPSYHPHYQQPSPSSTGRPPIAPPARLLPPPPQQPPSPPTQPPPPPPKYWRLSGVMLVIGAVVGYGMRSVQSGAQCVVTTSSPREKVLAAVFDELDVSQPDALAHQLDEWVRYERSGRSGGGLFAGGLSAWLLTAPQGATPCGDGLFLAGPMPTCGAARPRTHEQRWVDRPLLPLPPRAPRIAIPWPAARELCRARTLPRDLTPTSPTVPARLIAGRRMCSYTSSCCSGRLWAWRSARMSSW